MSEKIKNYIRETTRQLSINLILDNKSDLIRQYNYFLYHWKNMNVEISNKDTTYIYYNGDNPKQWSFFMKVENNYDLMSGVVWVNRMTYFRRFCNKFDINDNAAEVLNQIFINTLVESEERVNPIILSLLKNRELICTTTNYEDIP